MQRRHRLACDVAKAAAVRHVPSETRSAGALVARPQPVGRWEQNAPQRPDEITAAIDEEEADHMLGGAALRRRSMAQQPGHRGGSGSPRLEARHTRGPGSKPREWVEPGPG